MIGNLVTEDLREGVGVSTYICSL